jgi:hypothetical protein
MTLVLVVVLKRSTVGRTSGVDEDAAAILSTQDVEDGDEYEDNDEVAEEPDFEDDEEDSELERVVVLKFMRLMMETQAEFCANQMAMALNIQARPPHTHTHTRAVILVSLGTGPLHSNHSKDSKRVGPARQRDVGSCASL